MAPSCVSTDGKPEGLSSFLKRINFDVDLSPGAKQKASPKPKQVAPFAPPRVSSANASAPVKVAKLKPAASIEANLSAAPVPLKVKKVKPSPSPASEKRPVRFLYSPETSKLTQPPSTPEALWKQDFFPAPRSFNSQQRDSAPLDKHSPEHKERLLAIFRSDISSQAGLVFIRSSAPSTPPSQWDTSRPQPKSPRHNLPVDYLQHTLRSSSIGATMPPTNNFGLNSSKHAPESPGLSNPGSSSTAPARPGSSHSVHHRASPSTAPTRPGSSHSAHPRSSPSTYNPLDPRSRTGHSRPQAPREEDYRPQAVHTPLGYYENEHMDHSSPQVYQETLFVNSQAIRTPGLNFENERTRHHLQSEVHKRAAECFAQKAQQKEEELKKREEIERRIVKERELKLQAKDQRKDCERRLSRQSLPQGEEDQRRLAIARQAEIQGEENQRRLARQAQSLCEENGRDRKEEAERQRKILLAKQRAAELEKERQNSARKKEEAERVAELKRKQEERERQRIAQLKAEEEERQRIAKLKAEEERQRKAEEERQRIAKLKAEAEERQRKVEEEERQRKAEEEERQRKAEEEERRLLAELQAEEERRAQEYELLMQDLRQDATDKIQAHLNERLEAYDNFMAQLDEQIGNQAAEINSFESKIAAKETQIADLEKQINDLKSELSSMADAKMGMDKDLRDTQVKKSECHEKAQKLKQDAMAQVEQLKDTSLSSEGVENILNSFITTDDEIEVPELQLSQLSLRDRSECSDGESSGDEGEVEDGPPVQHPGFRTLEEPSVEADRVVKLLNLPADATVIDVQALVWGGPVAQIVYTPGSTEAMVFFLSCQDAQKYYNDTANHIPYPGDEDRLIRVVKCEPSPRHPFLRWAFEAGATRNVLTTGILPGWTKAELKNFAGKHGREVEQVLYGKTKSGVRKIEFRFLNIHHANAFKCLLKTDIDFFNVETEYAQDQCAVHRNVHLGPR